MSTYLPELIVLASFTHASVPTVMFSINMLLVSIPRSDHHVSAYMLTFSVHTCIDYHNGAIMIN